MYLVFTAPHGDTTLQFNCALYGKRALIFQLWRCFISLCITAVLEEVMNNYFLYVCPISLGVSSSSCKVVTY